METEEKTQPIKQLCTLHIGFPVESDEEAIKYKKEITNILLAIPTARIDFALVAMPTMPER